MERSDGLVRDGRFLLLPLAGGSAPDQERVDAVRNRRRVLTAAAELFGERPVDSVTMDAVAARAGVGKGTVYRRFGDRSGLAAALLDDRERELQQRILSGPPPLGPGAAPGERLAAFVRAYLDYAVPILDVVLLSQTSTVGARHRTGAHRFWVTHARVQLQAAGAPDADVRAEALLAALSAEQLRHWRDDTARGAQLVEALEALAITIATPHAGPSRRASADPGDGGICPTPGTTTGGGPSPRERRSWP